jgi:hypothetical protein
LTGSVTKTNVVWVERGSSGGNILDGGGLGTVEALGRVVSVLRVSYYGGYGGLLAVLAMEQLTSVGGRGRRKLSEKRLDT